MPLVTWVARHDVVITSDLYFTGRLNRDRPPTLSPAQHHCR